MERRFHPRVSARLSATVFSTDAHAFKVSVQDLSLTGLSFRCKTSERNLLTPRGNTLKGGHPIELRIVFRLDDTGQDNFEVKTGCVVIYSRRLSQVRCQLGVSFVDLPDAARQRIGEYVAARLDR